MINDFPYRALELPKANRFEMLYRAGYVDLDLDSPSNRRVAHCGRCGDRMAKGAGKAYSEFMAGGYRFTVRFICAPCLKYAETL